MMMIVLLSSLVVVVVVMVCVQCEDMYDDMYALTDDYMANKVSRISCPSPWYSQTTVPRVEDVCAWQVLLNVCK